MHIQKIEIRRIKSIKKFDLELEPDKLAGWHVLIGDNGSGKSTVLKAISLALIGAGRSQGLYENWSEWLPQGSQLIEGETVFQGRIELEAKLHFMDTNFDDPNHRFQTLQIRLTTTQSNHKTYVRYLDDFQGLVRDDSSGWFSVAYGPFRRFTGGNDSYQNIFKSIPKIAAHLSIFSEGVALSESMQWLQDLRFQELEARDAGQTEDFFLDKVRHFINQDEFLPYGVHLSKISSEGVFFTDANGSTVTVQNLSDGYRSILSMTFDIIRQMQIAYQTDNLFSEDFSNVKMPGVVLIDEVDAHLHPTWQRKIGPWFRQHFPNVQFIVTTHSPLICQAAAEGGSVWKLPRPGSDETCVRVTGQDLNRLLYGNILEAYSTQLFGMDKRSDQADEKLERLAELNIKEVFEGLTKPEQKEQEDLRATFPTASNKIEEHE